MENIFLKSVIITCGAFALSLNHFGLCSTVCAIASIAGALVVLVLLLMLINALNTLLNEHAAPILITDVFRALLFVLVLGSGIESGKKLLWWHPATLIFGVLIMLDIIFDATIQAVIDIHREVLKTKHYRTF